MEHEAPRRGYNLPLGIAERWHRNLPSLAKERNPGRRSVNRPRLTLKFLLTVFLTSEKEILRKSSYFHIDTETGLKLFHAISGGYDVFKWDFGGNDQTNFLKLYCTVKL
jgi:hypothetical protein